MNKECIKYQAELLRKIIKIEGSQANVADIVGCSRPMINRVLKEERALAAASCVKIAVSYDFAELHKMTPAYSKATINWIIYKYVDFTLN